MKYSDKQLLFNTFMDEWGVKFNNIPSILNYIASYPELIARFDNISLVDNNHLTESQFEWVSFVSQLDNPIENVFFKSYWVPVNIECYDCFIDLSSETYAVFTAEYFFFEPYRWYKKFLFNDIRDLLISVDDKNIDLEKHLMGNDNKRWALVDSFFKEVDDLGLNGKINIIPITKDRLFNTATDFSYILSDDSLILNGVNSIAIELIPFDTQIEINSYHAVYDKRTNLNSRIKDIRSFAYILQSGGFLNVNFYHLTFLSNETCFAEYSNHTLTIKHSDKTILKDIIEKYEFIRNLYFFLFLMLEYRIIPS